MFKKIAIITISFCMIFMLYSTVFTENIKAAETNISIDLNNAIGVLPLNSGGTDSTTVEQVKYMFGLGEVAKEDVLPILKGGTGATTAEGARKNLGLFNSADAFNKTYPVGSVFISFDDNADPAKMFGGEWIQINDAYLMGTSTKYPVTSMGGNNDEVLIAHSHSLSGTTSAAGTHQHGAYTVYDSNSGSTQGIARNGTGCAYHYGRGSVTTIAYAGAHSHTGTVTINSTGRTHTGGTGGAQEPTEKMIEPSTKTVEVNKNMPPYITVKAWKRLK